MKKKENPNFLKKMFMDDNDINENSVVRANINKNITPPPGPTQTCKKLPFPFLQMKLHKRVTIMQGVIIWYWYQTT